MAEIATIARPYAEALFKASSADLASTSAWLEELAQIAQQPDLVRFVQDPKTTVTQAFDLIKGLLKTSLSSHGQNFLRTVLENNRLVALPQIALQFKDLFNQTQGVADATVTSAFAIDEATKAQLQSVLEQRFAKRLNLRVVIDASLIGGVRAQVGDEVFDTSVKAQLAKMKMALTA